MMRSVVRNLNRNLVTAVAARNATRAQSTTTVPATIRLLRKYRLNSCCWKGLLGRRVGVLGLGPGAELLGHVGEAAVLDVSGGVGVAVLDDVGGALRVVEGGLDLLGAGLDGYVLDLDVGALVRLLEGGDGRVDDLLLRLVVDLLEEPDAQGPALVVPGGAVVRGPGGAGGGEGKCGRGQGHSDGELHGGSLRSVVATYAMAVLLCTTQRRLGGPDH
jgi:hypothetical protein